MSDRIFLSPPDVTKAEEDALLRAFRSGWIAPLGPDVDAFEAELAEVCGRRHAVALSSGTAALHLGLLSLGVTSDDVVLTSSMTFAATTNAITYTGATPVLIDSDAEGSMDADLLEQAFADMAKQGRRVAAVVPVDLLGKVVPHEKLDAIAESHGVPVFSDAAESLGAMRLGRPAASFGTAAAVSFNGNKIITTSGGGALVTDDEAMAQRVRYLATQARQPVVHYEHTDIGFNYRMSNLLAAMGRAQLERLPQMMERLKSHRRFYSEAVADLPGVTIMGEPSGLDDPATHDNWWLTSLLIEPEQAGFDRTQLMTALNAANIEARPVWKPMHLQPVYADRPAYVNGNSEHMFNIGLSLPSGSVLTDAQRDLVAAIIHEVAQA